MALKLALVPALMLAYVLVFKVLWTFPFALWLLHVSVHVLEFGTALHGTLIAFTAPRPVPLLIPTLTLSDILALIVFHSAALTFELTTLTAPPQSPQPCLDSIANLRPSLS